MKGANKVGMKQYLAALVGASLAVVALASCGKGDSDSPRNTDSATPSAVAVEDTENPACSASSNDSRAGSMIVVSLDSAAAEAKRLTITVVTDPQVLKARLQTSSGAVECDAQSGGIEFRVRESQTMLTLVAHTSTKNATINVRRLENGSMINGGAFAANGPTQEMVWAGATRIIPTERDQIRAKVRAKLAAPRD